jgi:hypothetical protein
MYLTRVQLVYPNGRVHSETLETWDSLYIGSVFQQYGHTWKAIRLTTPRSRWDQTPTSLICEMVDVPLAA